MWLKQQVIDCQTIGARRKRRAIKELKRLERIGALRDGVRLMGAFGWLRSNYTERFWAKLANYHGL